MTGISIDETYYDVRVVFKSLGRTFEIVEGANAGTALNARSIRDILGTAYSYEMQVEPNVANQADYDAFFQKISEPTDYHRVTLPYGQSTIEFDAKIISGSDVYMGKIGGNERWGNLSVQFIPMQPQRT